MTEDKRFFKKEYPHDWWFVFDSKQEYTDDNDIPFDDVDNFVAMSEKQVVDLLNENEQLKQRIFELELLNDGLNYVLKNIKKINVKIDVGDIK